MAPPSQLAASIGESHSDSNVQELINAPLSSVPPIYIRHGQESPGILDTNVSSQTLPTIDLKLLVSADTTDLELEKLHSACQEWGFFQAVNHGVSSSLLDKLKHAVEEFYGLPLDEKRKYMMRPGEVEGYGNLPRAGGKLDWADRFYMLTNPTNRRKSHLFPELPSFLRNTLEDYLIEMQKLGVKLVIYMANALQMDLKEMEDMFDDGFQSIRLTYYPPCPEPEMVMGITNHSDASGITILNQINGVDGLQIKKDGVWLPVSFLPDALVVNVGDILEILTNGVYKSIEHRAIINSEKERISTAFFMSPKLEVEIGPVTSLISPTNPPIFKRVLMEQYFKDFFARKLNGKLYLEHLKINSEAAALPDDKHI